MFSIRSSAWTYKINSSVRGIQNYYFLLHFSKVDYQKVNTYKENECGNEYTKIYLGRKFMLCTKL